MSAASEEHLDFIEKQLFGGGPSADISSIAPQLTDDDAYRLQFALAKRRMAAGGRLIGYKALSARRDQQPDKPGLGIGSLFESSRLADGATFALPEKLTALLEAEVAVLLKSDLEGPGVTPLDALRAVEGLFPAIELIERPSAGTMPSRTMDLATEKTNGCIVVGNTMSSPHGIDLRLEGLVISIDGDTRASATFVEVMDGPMNSVAAMANLLARFGLKLHAGMILMTGNAIKPGPIARGQREARLELTRLGSVSVRFSG